MRSQDVGHDRDLHIKRGTKASLLQREKLEGENHLNLLIADMDLKFAMLGFYFALIQYFFIMPGIFFFVRII